MPNNIFRIECERKEIHALPRMAYDRNVIISGRSVGMCYYHPCGISEAQCKTATAVSGDLHLPTNSGAPDVAGANIASGLILCCPSATR
jgi:hypothetical protein